MGVWLVLAACLAACASTPPTTTADLEGFEGEWVLGRGTVAGESVVPPDDRPITVTIEGSDIHGDAGCNNYHASVVRRGDALALADDGPASSVMLCSDAGLMAREEVYLHALSGLRQITMDGDEMVIIGEEISLRFTRASE